MGNYEEGRWRLNDPVSRYIPELAGLQVYAGEDADGSMRLEDAGHEMTMRELMTHTAGLGYVLNPRHPVPGMSFGMDFMIYDDPAAAGEPHAPGAYYWLGIDGTWFWIDPALDLAFVGMLQHQGRAQAEAHGLSRNWVYQAIVD